MSILSLYIKSVRNISSAEIHCSPRFNLFFGDNAAGKTSILEAINYLSTAKSFRTHLHNRVIQNNADNLTVFSKINYDNKHSPIGIQRFLDGPPKIHIDGEQVSSVAELSNCLPVQYIGSDSHRILSDGPKSRRHFLDWGLFHTNPLFFDRWKLFQKLLAQRNSALKTRAPRDELVIWNNSFISAANELNQLRNDYIASFTPYFNNIVSAFLPSIDLNLSYFAGWDESVSLETILSRSIHKEFAVGHSLFGPHRADLNITHNNYPAHDILSQGQQKLVSYALHLSQGIHLQQSAHKTPIYLIDDLPSELDPEKRTIVSKILLELAAQVFITGIEAIDLVEFFELHPENRMFHVKHGAITEFTQEKCFT